MKESKLSPSWIQSVLEEMSISQANNMLGQAARPDLKEKIKKHLWKITNSN